MKINTQKLLIAVSIISVLFVVNYVFKHPLNEITRVLYLDDLNFYHSACRNSSLIDAVLNTGANKFRPVAHTVLYAAYRIADTKFERLDIFIFVWNLSIAAGVTGIAFQLIEQRIGILAKTILSVYAGILYSISRFSYYVWTEVFGLMESTALILALLILMLLVNYISEVNERNLYIADLLYAFIIFTHERYVLLAGVIITAVFIKHGIKKPTKYMPTVLTAVIFFITRIVMFGSRFVDGTGGTSVIDTFSLKSMITSIAAQLGYILGINAGPSYLNGIDFREVSSTINFCIMIQIIFVLLCFSTFAILVLKKHDMEQIKKSIVFFAFAACCIVSSSVTIRVEMRWIYVSYAAFLIYLAYIVSYIAVQIKAKDWILLGFVYLGIGFVYENYYQSYYPNLYYWGTRSLTSSLYEETLKKYGEDFFQKEVYIVGNAMGWTDESWNQFYSQFFHEDIEAPKITYVEHIDELLDKLEAAKTDPIILLENLSECKYVNLSGMVSEESL